MVGEPTATVGFAAMSTSLPTGTVTFLFTDVEGSTRLWEGDREAMERLYRLHSGRVYSVVVRMVGYQDAEEVVQEAFLDVLKALPRYQVDGPARFETWLYRVTANRCKMRWRRKRLPTVEFTELAEDKIGDPLERLPDEREDHNPEAVTQQAETRRRIWRAVGRLSDAAREVVLLRNQIARSLGFDNYHRMNPAIPSVFFTHGNYLRNYTGRWDDKQDF